MSDLKGVLYRDVSEEGSSYTFRRIIDADHLAINRLAGRIRKILTSTAPASKLVELNSLLLEITWRLVRHDFSEDIVMRPALASVLGESGVEMVERDRADHRGGRDLLLGILMELEMVRKEYEVQSQRERFETMTRMVTETFDELGEHMRVESGEVLPRFESMISMDMSMKLAREYADTLIMTPSLTRRADDNKEQSRQVVFSGGVSEYIHTSPNELRELYTSILEETSDEEGKLWFDEVAQQELEKIQIDKKQKSNTVVDPGPPKGQKEKIKPKVLTNALGLPIDWDSFRKAKM